MRITKIDGELVVQIPAGVVAALGLCEGDDVELHALDAGGVAMITDRQRRDALTARIRELSARLPADYKFDREEANAR